MNVNKSKSFTLIELLVVVSILGLLFNVILTRNNVKKETLNVTNFKENITQYNKSFFYFCEEKQNKVKCYYLIDNEKIEDKNTLFTKSLPIKYKRVGTSFVADNYFNIFFNNYLYSEKTIFEYENMFYLIRSETDEILKNEDITELSKYYFNSDTKIQKNDIGE